MSNNLQTDVSISQESSKYVLFKVGSETYGLPILQIQEIISEFEFTKLPQLPNFCQGVISLRGEPIPVINLRSRFSLPIMEKTRDSRIIIIELDPNPIGLLVDEAHRVESISKTDIEDPPALSGGHKTPFITGVSEIHGSKFAILLNVSEILTTSEQVEIAEVTEQIKNGIISKKKDKESRTKSKKDKPKSTTKKKDNKQNSS
jgi:purine-binding chemotaxis protein CheW